MAPLSSGRMTGLPGSCGRKRTVCCPGGRSWAHDDWLNANTRRPAAPAPPHPTLRAREDPFIKSPRTGRISVYPFGLGGTRVFRPRPPALFRHQTFPTRRLGRPERSGQPTSGNRTASYSQTGRPPRQANYPQSPPAAPPGPSEGKTARALRSVRVSREGPAAGRGRKTRKVVLTRGAGSLWFV